MHKKTRGISALRRIMTLAFILILTLATLPSLAESPITLTDIKQILGTEPVPTPPMRPKVKVPAFAGRIGGDLGVTVIPNLVEGRTEVHTRATEEQVVEYSQKMVEYGFTLYSTTELTKDFAVGESFGYLKDQGKIILIYDRDNRTVRLMYHHSADYEIEGLNGPASIPGLEVGQSVLNARLNGQDMSFRLSSAHVSTQGVNAVYEVQDGQGNVEYLLLRIPTDAKTGSRFSDSEGAGAYVAYQENNGASLSAYRAPVAHFAQGTVDFKFQPEGAYYHINILATNDEGNAFQGTLDALLVGEAGETLLIENGSFVFQAK